MTERRPHWDDYLLASVMIHCNDIEQCYAVIAAVEDWHKAKRDSRIRTHSEGCWRWHTECAESLIEAQQKKIGELANQLLNEVPGSYIQMKARALTSEAAIARVRELHYNCATHHPAGCCSECGGTYPCPTVRAFDGGAE